MSWQLRRAGLSDVDAIMAIETATFVNDAWSTEAMVSDVGSPYGYYLVAFAPDAPADIVGYAGLRAAEGGTDGDIQTIAVSAGARGRGLGRGLMNALIGEARRRGAREIFLEVRADNPVAHGLYLSLGFEDIAVRPRYYQPDDVDAVVMRLRVPPVRARWAVGADATAPSEGHHA